MAHDINAVKKCLKDAGLYEENMDTKVMLEYYDAIKNSENTATAENEVRKSKEETAKKKEQKEHEEQTGEGAHHEESETEPEKPAPKSGRVKKEVATFVDMPACTEKMLDVVHHEPKNLLAVNFNGDAYKKLSFPQKVGLLFKYHSTLGKQMAVIARRSIHSAPWPKDIQSSARFNGSLLKSPCDHYDYSEQPPPPETIYTSRSGRQTKRKKYNEDFEYEEDVHNKKPKNDDEWTAGKLKAVDKKGTPQSQVADSAKASTQSQSGAKNVVQTPTANQSLLDTPTSSKSELKRPSLRRITNEEIMKRSSLFTPITTKKARPEVKSRAEQMFDNLKEDEKKKRQLEKENEIFELSLKDVELEEGEAEVVVAEKPGKVNGTRSSPPKRVSARRAINARKRLTPEYEEADSTNKVAKNVSKSVTNRSFLRNVTVTPDIDIEAIETEAVRDPPRAVKIDCPLCGVGYPEEDIQEHAATCCEPIDTSQSQITLRSTVKS